MLTMMLLMILRKYFPDAIITATALINKMRFRLLTVLFLTFIGLPQSVVSQESVYSVLRGSKTIGVLKVKREQKGMLTHYYIWSEARVGSILGMKVNVLMEETYSSDGLQNSLYIRKIGGIETVRNVIQLKEGKYQDNHRSNPVDLSPGRIDYSMGCMYFIEPHARKRVYSEYYRQFVTVASIVPGKYIINFPDGGKSYYTYRSGLLTRVEVHANHAVIIFKLNEEPVFDTISAR
jgi:hypothetical protein